MELVYIGAGFVGACSAAVSADSGHGVLAYDVDRGRVERLSSGDAAAIRDCLHEEGLAELVLQHAGRLRFTHDEAELAAALETADAVFMCLPTPERADGSSDLTFFTRATETLGDLLSRRNGGAQSQRVVIVNKSTVPIRTIDLSRDLLAARGARNVGIASNPEFLVEGQAIHDSIHPSRVVVGAEDPRDFETLRRVYHRFWQASGVAYLEMNPYEAATVKLLSNAALFNRLAFTFEVVGRACEVIPHLGYEKVKAGITADGRLGSWGFYDSLYAGGSCLIKDAQSLAWQLGNEGADTGLLRQILASNEHQLAHFLSRAEEEAGFVFAGKRVAVLGLAFKQGTNDVRHSGAIHVVRRLLGAGVAGVRAYDPAANGTFARLFDPAAAEVNKLVSYATSTADALAGCDAAVVCTDWPEFRGLGDALAAGCRAPFLLLDGRRMLAHEYERLTGLGFTIVAVGSPLLGKSLGGAS